MNRWFNVLLWLFAILYFGQILLVCLYSSSFPIGSAGNYDLALQAVFAENGDTYDTRFSSVYWSFYYLNLGLLLAGLILLGLRKGGGIWLFWAFIGLEVLMNYWLNSNTVITTHKILTVSGIVSYPLQGAILALYFSQKEQLGFAGK